MIEEHTSLVKRKDIDLIGFTERFLEKAHRIDERFRHIKEFSVDLAMEQARALEKEPKGKLAGVPLTVKDCLWVKGIPSSCGSRILEGFRPLAHATAVQRCIAEGAIIVGKTSQDEFGFGSFGVNVGPGLQVPLNPHDESRSCGGSSAGSAGFVAAMDFANASIAESTGGSIACPASFCGVVGLTPTYGRVSRYGLMDYGTSLDKIGPITKSVRDAALLLEVMAGKDGRDATSSPEPCKEYSKFVEKGVKGMRIGMIKEFLGKGCDPQVKEQVSAALEALKKEGAVVEEVSLPLNAEYSLPCYYLLAMAEASTNLAKYCGIRYGFTQELKGGFNEFFSSVRSEAFGDEAKRRILVGTFARMSGFRDEYYLKALKVRARLMREFHSAFQKFDLLASPTMPVIAPRLEDVSNLSPVQQYHMDVGTVGANLAGLPHLSLNVGYDKEHEMPIGLLLTADKFMEHKLIRGGGAYERI